MKKILAFLLTMLLAVPAFAAAETRTNETTGFTAVLDDSGNLLDAAEYDGVWESMMPITEHCNVGFYTYSGSDTGYVMNKAKAWANDNFPGTCTLFIIDTATRQLAVWSSSSVQKTLTQSKGYTITDNVYKYASRGDYAGCAVSAFNQMYKALNGGNVKGPMRVISNALLAILAAILLAYLFISARMEQEVKVSLPDIVTTTAAGAGAVIAAKTLTRKVRHSSSSGGGGGFHGGGGFGGGGGGGGFGGGGGSHGF
uniref:Beta-propeller domains of methanol dehydrogenase type n=1 Tax=uncultured bacterium Contigcl_1774 TaxID=1393661 RepID=W0FRN4_9BACT|nr:beta-propeller domains of methanol dehydrogenase type [uncultured bacterium Contigcl_1774]